MILKNLTQTPVTSTGTVNLQHGKLFGGYKLNADGTNLAILIIKDTDNNGQVLINTSTVIGEHVIQPMRCSGIIYYSVSGANADLMIFEAVREQI